MILFIESHEKFIRPSKICCIVHGRNIYYVSVDKQPKRICGTIFIFRYFLFEQNIISCCAYTIIRMHWKFNYDSNEHLYKIRTSEKRAIEVVLGDLFMPIYTDVSKTRNVPYFMPVPEKNYLGRNPNNSSVILQYYN